MTIGQYNPRSRGGVAYADLTRELLARAAAEAASEAVPISAAASIPPAAAGTDANGPADMASSELESELGAEAPEGIIDA
jgi:hypothetical protein